MLRGIDFQDVELVEGDTDKSHDTEYDPLEDSDYASSEDDEMNEKYVDLEVEASGWAKFCIDNIPHPPHTVKGKRAVQPMDCVDSGSDIDCVSASNFESLSSSDDGRNREKRIRPKQSKCPWCDL